MDLYDTVALFHLSYEELATDAIFSVFLTSFLLITLKLLSVTYQYLHRVVVLCKHEGVLCVLPCEAPVENNDRG